MMLSPSVASRSISALASRASSTLLRGSASTLVSASTSNAPTHCVSSQPLNNNHVTTTAPVNTSRSFSSMGMPRRAYPQYTIFGPDSALGVRAILPQFKRAGNDGVSVDRRGKLVVEFIPRNNTGAGFHWSNKTMFSLSVEEVGLLLSQLPGNSVELSHATYNDKDDGGSNNMGGGVAQLGGDVVEKVLTIEPGEGATLTFKIDYMSNGIGGQSPPGMEDSPPTPLEITIQAGEYEVLKSICQTSIPYLLGWNTTMDIASAAAMSNSISRGNQMY